MNWSEHFDLVAHRVPKADVERALFTAGLHRLWETSGRLQTDVARELGVMPTMLRRWQRTFEAKGAAKPPSASLTSPTDQASEIARLRRELDRTRTERDILN